MKRSAGGSDKEDSRRGVQWDEDNLEENERIKQELNPRKIDEPKTPYLSMSPMETDDEHDAAAALEGGAGPALEAAVASRPPRGSVWSDSSGHTSHSPSPRAHSHSPRFSEEYYRNGSDDEGGSDDPEKAEKKRRFKEARRQHYHMEFMAEAKAKLEEQELELETENRAAIEEEALAHEANGCEGQRSQQRAPEGGVTMAAPDASIL